MDTLFDLITKIIARPEIYIGRKSVERLYAFLCGFLYQNEASNDHCLDGFTAYIAEIYGIESDHNWASIITFFSNGEEDAFCIFTKHFMNFVNSK